MSERQTPETDAFADQMLEEFIDPAWLVFSQQLERERDEAREIAKEAINGLYNLGDYDLANRLASNLEKSK